jgi:arsenate reductase
MTTVLFVCVGNSARSQLAEAIARHLAPNHEFWSAGSRPSHVRPQVRTVCDEAGIDASQLIAKHIHQVPLDEVDLVVTLCAETECPVLPISTPIKAWPLPDPAAAPDHELDEAFRATRDELLRRLPRLLQTLPET